MQKHDTIKELEEIMGNSEVFKKISPEYSELNMDIQEIMAQSKNPMFIAVLLFKLAQEREKTNQMLEKINEKFDQIMLRLKTQNMPSQGMPMQMESGIEAQQAENPVPLKALPDQDQLIVHLAFEKGQISAEEVKKQLGYKGKNAASQRLNKLFKEGHLKKLQAGRKVVYMARQI